MIKIDPPKPINFVRINPFSPHYPTLKALRKEIDHMNRLGEGLGDPASIMVAATSRPDLFSGDVDREHIERVYNFLEMVWMAPNLNWYFFTEHPENAMSAIRTLKYMAEPRNEGFRWWLHAWFHTGLGEAWPPENIFLGTELGFGDPSAEEVKIRNLVKTRMGKHFVLMVDRFNTYHVSFIEADPEPEEKQS